MMSPSPTHLVLIPSYNTGAKLAETIKAARAAWAPVWVVIDGSTDGTGEVAAELAREDPHLRVIVRSANGGKGAALLEGLRAAEREGFTHVLTMDSDGQHPADRIANFMAASQADPLAIVLGAPLFDQSAPAIRLFGRAIANFWVNVLTLFLGIKDSLFGFRVYPVAPLRAIMERTRWMRGFDFDAEAAVRLVWDGFSIVNLDAPCRYLSTQEGGISHFRYWRDNVLIVWMMLRLLAQFPRRLPRLLAMRLFGGLPEGSEAHKILFCRTLLDTFNPYKPAVIDWPRLENDARTRLIDLPIWDIAVQTEGKAGLRVATYGETLDDPLLKDAVALNAFEERRHKHVLSNLVAAYGIALAPEPDYLRPRDPEWAFLVTGYSECIDSFFAFGLFAAARMSGFFPPALVETFEPVIAEEARHILFFVNWVAWHRRNMPLWRRPIFAARVAGVWAFLIWERIQTARDLDGGNNFTMTGAQKMDIALDLDALVALCLTENDRRLAPYDRRLRRPVLVPAFARVALKAMHLVKRGAAKGARANA